MSVFRVRSSFLSFDRNFHSVEEIEYFLNTHFGDEMVQPDEIREHFTDKNVPFFGVKGIIVTRENSVSQEETIGSDKRREEK